MFRFREIGRKEVVYSTMLSTYVLFTVIWCRTYGIGNPPLVSSKGYFICTIPHTYHSLCNTSRGALAGMANSSMGPP